MKKSHYPNGPSTIAFIMRICLTNFSLEMPNLKTTTQPVANMLKPI